MRIVLDGRLVRDIPLRELGSGWIAVGAPQDGQVHTWTATIGYAPNYSFEESGTVGPCLNGGEVAVTADPARPSVTESTACAVDDELQVPASIEQVSYEVNDKGSGTFEVTARAEQGYVFANGQTARQWTVQLDTVANGGVNMCAADPAVPVVNPASCDTDASFARLADGEGYAFDAPVQNADGSWKVVARALPGYEFGNGKTIRTFSSPYVLGAAIPTQGDDANAPCYVDPPSDTEQSDAEQRDTEQSDTELALTTETPVLGKRTDAPKAEPNQEPKEPEAVGAPVSERVASPVQETLAYTGSNTWYHALVGSFAIVAGGLLLLVRRLMSGRGANGPAAGIDIQVTEVRLPRRAEAGEDR